MQRENLSADRMEETLRNALRVDATIVSATVLLPDALRIAASVYRAVYDCTYLALAIREQCPLVTADERFFNALNPTPFAQHLRLLSKLAK